MMLHDRRLEYRIHADIIIHRLDLPGERAQTAKGIIRELSASGCRIECAVVLSVDQDLRINFQLSPGHVMKKIQARVVRRLSHRSHKVVALEFVDLPEVDQQKIREFVVWKESQQEHA